MIGDGSLDATERTAGDDLRPLPVPGPTSIRGLTFLGIVLAAYWIAPPFLGLTNLAGDYDLLGRILFVAAAGSTVALVLVPLRRRLRVDLDRPSDRWSFAVLAAGAAVAGMFVTNTFQLVGPWADAGPLALVSQTIYTPFGAWPSLVLLVPSVGLVATLDLVTIAALGLLGYLGAAAVVLRRAAVRRAGGACPRPSAGPVSPAAGWAAWLPLGLITACPGCAPVYLVAFATVAPSMASGGLAFLPWAPWIGLAGLLYLASFALVVWAIRGATSVAAPMGPAPGASP